ncbi:MAG: SAM-dependent methyltransferase [Trebonia sp.]
MVPPQIYESGKQPGGKDNYAADKQAATEMIRRAPEVRDIARVNREFLGRVVRFLAGEAGIRQFLDVGTGIPTGGNVHEVAGGVAPEAHVAYIDNDPIVNVHANALLTGGGTTGIVLADLRDPKAILAHPTTRRLIDFDQPVALLLISILHFIRDEEHPAELVATLRDALPSGSYLALSHVTGDYRSKAAADVAAVYDQATSTATLRSHNQISALFSGFDLVEPGLVQVPLWRPDGDLPVNMDKLWIYGGVARLSER